MNQEPLFNQLIIEREIRSRFNPLPGLTPEKLTRQIEEFRAGRLRELALTMDAMEERDDLLAAVVPKAKAAPTIHGWEINTVDTDSESEAAMASKQKETLEFFYNNLRATSAIEQDLLGGLELLLEQMMDAKGKRYSVHNLVWKPAGPGLYTVTAHHVPLWFFEARTGRLRFLKESLALDGEDLQPGAWLVSVGKGLMIPCAVAWMFKHLPLRDWLLYCRRHGLPGIEGVTDAVEGSEEYKKLETAVRAAAGGAFAWVRSENQKINTVDFSADGNLPMPELVERMDRAMAAIWRGGDLSTMSKGQQAVGAQGQKDESEIVEARDAAWLSGQLNMRLDRLVLDYVYGPDAPALAYITIKTAQKQDLAMDLKIDEFAMKNGHPISRKQFAERYNRPEPGDEDELLSPAQESSAPPPVPALNEAKNIDKAFRDDLAGVIDEVRAVLNSTDLNSGAEKLRRSLASLWEDSGDSAADELEDIMAAAFVTGAVAGNTDLKPMKKKSIISRFLERIRPKRVEAVNEVRPISSIAFAVNETIDGEGDWFRLAPLGEWPNEVGMQIVDAEAAKAMVSAFNSVIGKVARFGRGLPIYVGHPSNKKWRDENPHIYAKWPHPIGRITAMEMRGDEAWFKPAFNEEGLKLVKGDGAPFASFSPGWGMIPVQGRSKTFRPVLLDHIGLTNFPQISGTNIGLNEAEQQQQQTKEDNMPEWLRTLLGLKPEATEDEGRNALQSALNERQAATQRVTALEAEVGQLTGKLTTATNEVTTLKTTAAAERKARAAVIVTQAINEGRIKEADRATWQGSLEAAADFDAEAKKLGSLQPAINTTPVNLGSRREEGNPGNITAINEAVQVYAKEHGIDTETSEGWNRAFNGAKQKNPQLFDNKKG